MTKDIIRDIVHEELERFNRKETFREAHRKAINENEDVMKRFYGILSNGNAPVQLNEVTLDRILKKHGNNGLASISANRSDDTAEQNEINTRNLIGDLKRSGFSYLPVYGGYRGTDGVEDDYEPSFVVFNYDINGNATDFNNLMAFAVEMCGKYNQDSVLIKAPNKNPIYVNRNGEKVNSTESGQVWKNDPKQAFFTSLKDKKAVNNEIIDKIRTKYKAYCRKNHLQINDTSFEQFYNEHKSEIDSIGKRYTYDIQFECYVNPMPCQLTERQRRKGEIMVWD